MPGWRDGQFAHVCIQPVSDVAAGWWTHSGKFAASILGTPICAAGAFRFLYRAAAVDDARDRHGLDAALAGYGFPSNLLGFDSSALMYALNIRNNNQFLIAVENKNISTPYSPGVEN